VATTSLQQVILVVGNAASILLTLPKQDIVCYRAAYQESAAQSLLIR